MTGATVLQLLLPLLIILLTYDTFSAERELGTLRQLLSLGVPPAKLAAGKALGIAACLGMLLVPAALIVAGALALSSEDGSFTATGPPMALLTAAYLLYFAAFTGVSVAVSAKARSSRLALLALLGFWIFNGLIAPKAVADLARRAHPSPSALEFARGIEHDIEQGVNGHDPSDKRGEEPKQRLIKQYNVESVDKLPVNFAGISMQEGEEYGNRVFDKHYAALWDTYERQRRMHEASAIVASVLAARSLSMALAGTDVSQHVHFTRAAEDYRRLINREMNMDLARIMKGSDYSNAYTRGRDLWEKIPDFDYRSPGLDWVMSHQWFSSALLGAWALLACVAAYEMTRRLSV